MTEIKNAPDLRTAAEIEAEANAAFLAAEQHRKDNPTGDEDEDAFLRAFRSIVAGKMGHYTDAGYEIETDSGLVSLTFADALARHKVVSAVSIFGDTLELSLAAKRELWKIVMDEHTETIKQSRDTAARTKLRDFVKKVQSA